MPIDQPDDSDPSMWSYWRDKHGIVAALEHQFPNLLKQRPDMAAAVHNIKVATGYLDSEMTKLDDGHG